MDSAHDPRQNHLLAALPADECARIFPNLELVPMPLGEALYESGIQMHYVYFPTTAIVSLLYVMEDGASAEIAVVGNEGIVGVALFMGGETTHQPGRRAKRRPRLSAEGAAVQGRVLSRRPDAPPIAALHSGAADADGADGGVQSASFGGPATVPLAAAEPGPPVLQRAEHDAGADRQHARGAPRRRHRGCREVAARRVDSLQPRAASPCWIGPDWRRASANATVWSSRSSIACSRR